MPDCATLLQTQPNGPGKNATKIQKSDWWNCYFVRQMVTNPTSSEAFNALITQFRQELITLDELSIEFVENWIAQFKEIPDGQEATLELSSALPSLVDVADLKGLQILTHNAMLRAEIFASLGNVAQAAFADEMSVQLEKLSVMMDSRSAGE